MATMGKGTVADSLAQHRRHYSKGFAIYNIVLGMGGCNIKGDPFSKREVRQFSLKKKPSAKSCLSPKGDSLNSPARQRWEYGWLLFISGEPEGRNNCRTDASPCGLTLQRPLSLFSRIT
jgi:hypothetical protein